jgi:hypothetical protein
MLVVSFGLLLGGSTGHSAPPVEWVARGVAYAQCGSTGGTTNLSSSGSGTDFAHSLACTLDAATITTGTVVRACAHVTVTTGTSAPLLQFKLKAGSTTLSAPNTAGTVPNSITRTSVVCFVTMGGAVPGASAATYTALEGFPTEFFYTDLSNSVTQPVTLNTAGTLAWTFVSQWSSAGVGSNVVTLNSWNVTLTK